MKSVLGSILWSVSERSNKNQKHSDAAFKTPKTREFDKLNSESHSAPAAYPRLFEHMFFGSEHLDHREYCIQRFPQIAVQQDRTDKLDLLVELEIEKLAKSFSGVRT